MSDDQFELELIEDKLGLGTDENHFELALVEVAADRKLTLERLGGLSHLDPGRVERFREIWEALSAQRKLDLLDELSSAEADSLRLEFNAIYHLAMEDEDSEVRERGLESTIEDDSDWLLNRLLTTLVEDPEPVVRRAAAFALQPFAHKAELGELIAEATTRTRLTLLETVHRSGERTDVRAEALATLGYFGDEQVQGELQSAFHDESLRLQALRGMGHSADDGWLDIVLDELESPDERLRQVAAEAAGEIGSARAVPALVELIDDDAHEVRLAAIASLGEIGGHDAREALVYALQDERAAIREAAGDAIDAMDLLDEPFEL